MRLGETEAGSAGKQPRRGITRWAHRHDERQREITLLALPHIFIGSIDPYALKIPAEGGIFFHLQKIGSTPIPAEPRQFHM
jgi:hypothetical protein